MLSRIKAWLSNGDGGDGGRDGSDGDGDAPPVDRTRPLAPVKDDEFLVGPAFVVLDGDRPGSGVPGESLNRLHETASERFDVDAVSESHKVADVALAADGEVLDVEWYDEPTLLAGRYRDR